ncbi:MAG: polyketide cyclase [Roseivirga sp.]|nr:polyketide cyclase [Roseivirga sp.]
MKKLSYNTSLWFAFVLTALYGTIGILTLNFDLADYGWGMFAMLPFCVGLAAGLTPKPRNAFKGVGYSLGILFVVLIFTAIEGIVCILLMLPIFGLAIGLGFLIGSFFRRAWLAKYNNARLQLLPLVLFLGVISVENRVAKHEEVIYEVRSEIILPYSPEEVYDAIKSVDTLIAEKPFLMKLDLPVPQKCILEKEEVGALRICYFEGGRIIERVTELERGEILKMDVIDYELTGREWLGFKEAIYYFEPMGTGGCKMTRVTTYSTELYPRAYWKPLERLGIEQEHEYVFRNLQRDLLNAHGVR